MPLLQCLMTPSTYPPTHLIFNKSQGPRKTLSLRHWVCTYSLQNDFEQIICIFSLCLFWPYECNLWVNRLIMCVLKVFVGNKQKKNSYTHAHIHGYTHKRAGVDNGRIFALTLLLALSGSSAINFIGYYCQSCIIWYIYEIRSPNVCSYATELEIAVNHTCNSIIRLAQ